MALRLKSGEVPEHAVILTKREAVSYQWKQIMDWKPSSDVWPYTHGLGFLGGVSALTGMYINLRFRKAMKFKNLGGLATLTVTSVCPGFMTCLLQMRYVAENTFLPVESCPLCFEIRSIAIQNATAIAYPSVLVPIANFMLALRGQTHRIPHYKNWRELLIYCGYLYKPMLPTIAFLGVANSIAASFILYKQVNCLSYMREMLSLENEDDRRGEELNNLF